MPVNSRARTSATLAACILAAFAIRVLPAYHAVFGNGFVGFQEGDAWFHVRTVHNLLAHFPHRSGFDPYMLYPGGRNIPTGPLWDYVLAIPAWLLGFGSPSPELIDRVCAWMPAILGALFPLPVWLLACRYFDELAAAFAALWVAVASGAFLWITHLGLADHHVAESLFSFLALALLAEALERGRPAMAWLAGIAIGLFLATRPVGIFVPAILAALVVLAPAASFLVLRTMIAAAAVFLIAAGSLWSGFSWMSLGMTAALAAAIGACDYTARVRGWRPAIRRALPFTLVALGVLLLTVIDRGQVANLAWQLRRLAGLTPDSLSMSTVLELQPIYRTGPIPGLASVIASIGVVWIPAIAGLVLLLIRRPFGPGSVLLTLWTVVMTIGGVTQLRMTVYLVPVAAVLAGGACAQLMEWAGRWRAAVASAIAAVILAVSLPSSIAGTAFDRSPDSDWRSALAWLRLNSPEPLDPAAWTRYYPRIAQDPGPQLGWGVAVWWDFGYIVEQLARRIPMSNGTQGGAEEVARFYLETIPEAAVKQLRRDGARYAILDQRTPFFVNRNESYFPLAVKILGRDLRDFVQVLAERGTDGGEGSARAVPVYLANYYQTMASRLYLNDGDAVTVAGDGPWVFMVEPVRALDGQTVNVIVESHHCGSATELAVYLRSHHVGEPVVGCLDPGRSCFDLPAVKGLRRVFTSDPLPVSHERTVHAVKIFEVTPE